MNSNADPSRYFGRFDRRIAVDDIEADETTARFADGCALRRCISKAY
jgi:hypothetical protein